jgi:HD superfamily phosphodiesterase
MNTRQTKLLKNMETEAIRVFWEESFGGMSRGSRHLFRVHEIAVYLWEREGGDQFIVLAGAWVHDVSLVQGSDHDPESVASFTRNFLHRFDGLRMDEIDRIVECAGGHEIGHPNLSLEAKIVHDADVVDKSGMLGVVRHVWKMTNLLENRILSKQDDLKRLRNHLKERQVKLFTNTAKNLAKSLNKSRDCFFRDEEFALRTIAWISEQANQGVISDEIAENLAKESRHESARVLKDQLSCSYLRSLKP